MINRPIGTSAIITAKEDKNKFIAVHRKENPELVCFPGGKLDPSEDIVKAVAREVLEETGLNIPVEKFMPIYVGVCEGAKEYWVTVFWTEIDFIEELISPEPEMKPCWTNKKDFMEKTAFPIFNGNVFKNIDIL